MGEGALEVGDDLLAGGLPALVRLGVAAGRVVVVPIVLDAERDGRFALPTDSAEALVADLRRTGFVAYPWRRDDELEDALGDRGMGIPESAAWAVR